MSRKDTQLTHVHFKEYLLPSGEVIQITNNRFDRRHLFFRHLLTSVVHFVGYKIVFIEYEIAEFREAVCFFCFRTVPNHPLLKRLVIDVYDEAKRRLLRFAFFPAKEGGVEAG
ncbi:TPA: hypothetical protein JJI70_18105 [Cronobacter sakazakii]|nr:hypothetical protein [Cronobacter sakazakii]HAV6914065.1 hypothetical protein [Cronobacter sakazakii]